MSVKEEVSSWIDAHEREYVEDVKRLVAIRSVRGEAKPGMPYGEGPAAALAEAETGAAKGLKNCVYVTIGTGVGAGIYCEGNLVHGLMHPEFGHILLSPHPDDPMPRGVCPYHAGCLEGLASGPSIEKRWGVPARELPADHPAWRVGLRRGRRREKGVESETLQHHQRRLRGSDENEHRR